MAFSTATVLIPTVAIGWSIVVKPGSDDAQGPGMEWQNIEKGSKRPGFRMLTSRNLHSYGIWPISKQKKLFFHSYVNLPDGRIQCNWAVSKKLVGWWLYGVELPRLYIILNELGIPRTCNYNQPYTNHYITRLMIPLKWDFSPQEWAHELRLMVDGCNYYDECIYFFPTEIGDGTSVSFANKNGRINQLWMVLLGFATKRVAQHPPRPRVGSPSLCRPSPRPQPSRVQRRCLAPDREVWPGRGSLMVVAISNPPKRCRKANWVTILIVFASLDFFWQGCYGSILIDFVFLRWRNIAACTSQFSQAT